MKLKTKEVALVGLFTALICILSILRIPLPFTPIPITLQVLAVAVTGAVLGSKLGFFALVTYVLLGFIGLPVYSGFESGPGVLFGARGGYIFGFVAAAFVIGLLMEKCRTWGKNAVARYSIILGAMVIGVMVIYTLGVLQLMMVAKMDIVAAVHAGALPFIGADLLKILLGSIIAYFVREALSSANLLPTIAQ